jgi:hypothetical protein
LANLSHKSHSEAIAGVRIKRFLTMAILTLSKELLVNSRNKEETNKFIEKNITDLVKSSFTLSSSDNPVSQAKLFVASLGFSPCEIEWAEDVRLGKFLLGKSRLWRASNEKEHELIKLLILAIVKGLGSSFVDGNVEVNFVDGILPPRFSYEIQFRTSEDVFAESIKGKEEESGVLLSAGSLLDPIIGSGLQTQSATQFLLEATQSVVEELKPDLLQRQDIQAYPLKLLEVLYLQLKEDLQFDSAARQIGIEMIKLVRQEFPHLKNHQLLKGIGLLPPEEIDELLFYGSSSICGVGKEGINLRFCQFLGHIWSGYASEVLGKKFLMLEDPLCATGTGTKCIFTLEEAS